MRRFFSFILICMSTYSFSQDSTHFLSQISSEDEYALLKGDPNTSKFGEVDAVKVLYDIKNDSIYFINSDYYNYHVSFCMDYLGYDKNSWKFNYNNYTTNDKRAYLMGTINRFYKKNIFTLEFSVADNISIAQVKTFHQKIIENFQLSKDLKLFLNTNRMLALSSNLIGIETISASDIYEGQSLQILNQKEAYGNLVFVDAKDIETAQVKYTDIVIVNGTPKELPPVAGVITTDFQTPLSHITILCQNRGTPVIAFKDAWKDSLLRLFENKSVRFTVHKDSFEIINVETTDVDKYWKTKRDSIQSISLYTDTSIQSILPIDLINKNSINIVGGKAANFGELVKLVKELELTSKTPEAAFAIPFYFYSNNMNTFGIQDRISQFVASKGEGYDDKMVREFLSDIRQQIMESKLDQRFLSEVSKQVKKNGFTRVRFRSSTNAEDLDGFNGAGLYDSKTGILNNQKKSFELAIKKVWASAWNYKAFMEREYFGINQESISMGILCHRSFPNETANGVVITKNLYRNNYRGFVINAQYGETSVVNPPDGVTCEQMICYSDKNDSFYGKKKIVEYLSYSNMLPDSLDKVILTKEVTLLTEEISKIKMAYYSKFHDQNKEGTYYNYGLDLEFKIYGSERQLYIKQIRPFQN
ncbi:PEP/pyruvate-binding domain-containing protein [Crocinitomicaceae bacterium]|nr:PEP/pyruvate-binding domain-containing protein [Crocinitomicaceae bacterium]MDC0460383.1 PEP/pyruvate-binding domain-containing protein [Crocinitomicaceae bacterium]